MFGTFALLSLVLMLWLRYRYGPALWDDVALKTSYAFLGFVAAGVAMVNGSLGGEAGLLGTALSRIWGFLGVLPADPMVLPAAGGIALFAVVCVGIAEAVVAFISAAGLLIGSGVRAGTGVPAGSGVPDPQAANSATQRSSGSTKGSFKRAADLMTDRDIQASN